jgi:hypothetical protein
MWDNITYRLTTPDGKAIVSIAQDTEGDITHISFAIGKAGSSTNAYCYALAEVVTALIKARGLSDALELLSGISTDRIVRFRNGITCRSGVEALYYALLDWRNSKPKIKIERPPKFARLA